MLLIPKERLQDVLRKELRNQINVEKNVRTIIDNVRANGDKSLLYYTEKFDGVRPELAVFENASTVSYGKFHLTLRRS